MSKSKPMFVEVDEVMTDWGVSKAKAYQIIRDLSSQMKLDHPGALTISGKVNRRYYEEKTLVKG